jgi:hypothetical protein
MKGQTEYYIALGYGWEPDSPSEWSMHAGLDSARNAAVKMKERHPHTQVRPIGRVIR